MKRLTLACRQWETIHDLLHAVLSSPKCAGIRGKTGELELKTVAKARDAIKVSVEGASPLTNITIEDTAWVMSRIPWVINEAAGFKLKYINSSVLGDINTQLQKSQD